MTGTSKLLLWAPRILGILMALFLALFALDAFKDGARFRESLLAFAIHLAPALVLMAIVALAWRWEWIGALAFIGLGAAYMVIVRGRLDWMLVISAPLLAIGACYFWSWRHHHVLHRVK
jgi:hypothetical protein